jgi:hypothetical protein
LSLFAGDRLRYERRNKIREVELRRGL